MALGFRDSEALQVVLQSGMASLDLMSRGAQVAHGDDGTLILLPDGALPEPTLTKLRTVGVSIDAEMPAEAREVRCWAEAVAPVRAPPAGVSGSGKLPSLVLLVTERASDLIDLAAELLRLGCDRQELLVAGAVGVARVVDPPTYTVVRAIDRERGLRVYAPDPAGQDAVWTELGFRHPLAAQLRAEQGTLLLIDQATWRVIPDRDWASLDAALELAIPGDDLELETSPLRAKREVALRLGSGRRDVPSLWVIRNDGLAAIDRLLDYLPDDIVARLTFAATGGPEPVIVIRARAGRHPAPDLMLDAEAYAPLAQMPDLYAPADALVEPPLRRERLRSIIGVDPGEIVWLVRTTGTRFRVERVVDTAFTPLSEWADYIIHDSAAALVPWMRAAVFDFAELVSTGVEWAAGVSVDQHQPSGDGEAKKQARRPRPRAAADVEAPTQAPRRARRPTSSERPSLGSTALAEIAIDHDLAALEGEFVALDAPGDAPERLALLDQLGHAYTRLGRRRDAGLCFVRAVWESSGPDATARLDRWITADLQRASAARALEQALALAQPNHDHVRTVAVLAARADTAVAKDPHRVQRWLDEHDGDLDARTLWLARIGLATLAGGDELGLAQARDRILARLAGGLPLDRELPSFLRFAGRSGALGNASGEILSTALDSLARTFERTRRVRHPIEAPVAYTGAYVGYQLAYAFARIGKHDRARMLIAASISALKPVEHDPVHRYLAGAFGARVEQAIAGLPPETPLPDELTAQLGNFTRETLYKVERLSESSRILEPLERPQAMARFLSRTGDSRGTEFAALRTMTDLVVRAKAVDELVTLAADSEPEREHLLAGVFDLVLELPESAAAPILLRTLPVVEALPDDRRAVLYTRALVVAGHVGRTELVPELLALLRTSIRAVTGAALARVLQHSMRALRRIGLRHEIAELLADAEQARPATRAVDTLRGRLALAGGLAYLGDFARALPIFDQARCALDGEMSLPERLDLTRALALAYAQAPLDHALAGIAALAGQFREITDMFGTNSHYCLSVLHFVDSLVLGIASDDLALGEAGRRFIDDDEHLIRRRLHRDLGGHS